MKDTLPYNFQISCHLKPLIITEALVYNHGNALLQVGSK